MKYIKIYENLKTDEDQIKKLIFDDNYPFKLKQSVKTIDIWDLRFKYGKENIDNFLTDLLYDKEVFFYTKNFGNKPELKNGTVLTIYSSADDIFHASILLLGQFKTFPIYSKIYTKEELDYEEAEMKLQANKYNL